MIHDLERCVAGAALAASVALVLAFSRSDALRRPVAILVASALLSTACLSPGPAVSVPARYGRAEALGVECFEGDVAGEPKCVMTQTTNEITTCGTVRVETDESKARDQRCRFLTDKLGKVGSYTQSDFWFLDNGRIRSYMAGNEVDSTKSTTCYIIPTDAILGGSNDGCDKTNLGLNENAIVQSVEMDDSEHKCNIYFTETDDESDTTEAAKDFLGTLQGKALDKLTATVPAGLIGSP